MDLFAGFRSAHGTHGVPYYDDNHNKWSLKNPDKAQAAKTVREPVTVELWGKHIGGVRPLGIIPIDEEGMCVWGSIDVDDYQINAIELVQQIEQLKLPLVPCRSKSGGMHLFLFLSSPATARSVQKYLKDVAAVIGRAGSEIFPKQTEILASRGDLGNWMVMPYYGSDYDGKLFMQYGIKKTGGEQTIQEFLTLAHKRKVAPDQLVVRKPRLPGAASVGAAAAPHTEEPFSDGPPCLQHLVRGGVKPGGQNNTLLMMGIYFKRKYPNDPNEWKKMLEQANHSFLDPPGASDALASVIRSLEAKDYLYTCKSEPMVSHCNSQACRIRRFGVGVAGAFPVISGISKLNTDPPIWFVDVEDRRLEIATEVLQNYTKFHAACMERVDKSFVLVKQSDWMMMLADAMQNLQVIEAPPEIGRGGVFFEMLEDFLTNRQRGQHVEDILMGRPWEDQEAGRHYFQIKDLDKFMRREGEKNYTRGHMTTAIKKLGGDAHFMNIKGAGRNCWWVPSALFRPAPVVSAPNIEGAPV